MLTVKSDKVCFSLDATSQPVTTVSCGQPFVVQTRDALDGQVSETDEEMSQPTRANPVTGPLAVEGILADDTLCVEILAVTPGPKGYLTFQRQPRFFDQSDGMLRMFNGIQLAIEPMIGTIGVLPRDKAITTKEAGIYGGNMDTRDVAPGSSLYFRCGVDGAGLYLGDVHSLQGDGETSGQGVETSAEVTLRLRKLGKSVSVWPYIVRDGRIALLVSSDTLDEAAAIAVEESAQILTAHSQLTYGEARMLLGVCGDLRVGQIVNPQKTIRFSFPIAVVPWKFQPGQGFL